MLVDPPKNPFSNTSVSLLINFEMCTDPLDWTRGVHGIRISFPQPQSPSRRRLSATYLPDVCTEQGWTKDECLESLMRKAGYNPTYNRGPNGGWRKLNAIAPSKDVFLMTLTSTR